MTASFRVLRYASLALALGFGPAFADSHACGVLSPRYEPKSPAQTGGTPVRFKGGARLSAPVATPCPRQIKPLNA